MAAEAATILLELSKSVQTNFDKGKQYQLQIRELGHEGDQLIRKLFTILDQAFVTPLDREDISRLCKAIEKVLNNIRRVADNIILFNISKLSLDMLELIQVLREVSQKIAESVSQLRKLKKASIITERSGRIAGYEDKSEAIYEKAISALFKANDAIEILKSKEIYDFLSRAIGRCIDLSEFLEDIALKYA